jgi:hypothetical protein
MTKNENEGPGNAGEKNLSLVIVTSVSVSESQSLQTCKYYLRQVLFSSSIFKRLSSKYMKFVLMIVRPVCQSVNAKLEI